MDYCVIAAAGSQYLVEKGTILDLANLNVAPDQTVEFPVLLAKTNGQLLLGKPLVPEIRVVGQVRENFRGSKLDVVKFKAKSRYRRKIGFRPKLTKVEITHLP